jgi:hypothetical protein
MDMRRICLDLGGAPGKSGDLAGPGARTGAQPASSEAARCLPKTSHSVWVPLHAAPPMPPEGLHFRTGPNLDQGAPTRGRQQRPMLTASPGPPGASDWAVVCRAPSPQWPDPGEAVMLQGGERQANATRFQPVVPMVRPRQLRRHQAPWRLRSCRTQATHASPVALRNAMLAT